MNKAERAAIQIASEAGAARDERDRIERETAMAKDAAKNCPEGIVDTRSNFKLNQPAKK